jgi:hypothetical protein
MPAKRRINTTGPPSVPASGRADACPVASEGTGTVAKPIRPYLVEMYVYRHVLRNLKSEYRARQDQEKRDAPAIAGARAAAVLARLWVDAKLGCGPFSQTSYGEELGIGDAEIGQILKHLEAGQCVENRSTKRHGENLYAITPQGKNQIEDWVLAHYTDESFFGVIEGLSPNVEKLASAVGRYVDKAKELLRIPGAASPIGAGT